MFDVNKMQKSPPSCSGSRKRMRMTPSTSNIFEGLLQKRWKIFNCTRLYNISFQSKKLKLFCHQIESDLQSKRKNSKKIYIVTLSIQKSCTPSPLLIKITLSNEKVVYNAICMTWDDELEATNNNNNSFYYPLMFCTGEKQILDEVHMLLMKYCDCTIVDLQFSQREFQWLTSVIIHSLDEDFDGSIEFGYTINETSFFLEMPFSNIKKVWLGAHNGSCGQISDRQVRTFHNNLLEHVKNTVMDLSYSNLFRLEIKKAIRIDNTGKIHMLSQQIAQLLCRCLKDIIRRNE